jgi:type II secretory pathway component PulK
MSPAEYLLVALMLSAVIIAAMLSSRPVELDVTTQRVLVRQGESLWTLAERYPAQGLSTRETVELLSEVNDLKSSTIVAGTSLDVPVPAERLQADTVAMR